MTTRNREDGAIRVCATQKVALLLYGGKVPMLEKPTVFLYKGERVVILCEWADERFTIVKEADWTANRYIVRDAGGVFNGAGDFIWYHNARLSELEQSQ